MGTKKGDLKFYRTIRLGKDWRKVAFPNEKGEVRLLVALTAKMARVV
jgi:hypothetical protein